VHTYRSSIDTVDRALVTQVLIFAVCYEYKCQILDLQVEIRAKLYSKNFQQNVVLPHALCLQCYAFSALTLLVGYQEEHPVCKN